MTTSITVNTDFALVEADEQQVNLTRFSLFFPEKREFFLENQFDYITDRQGTLETRQVLGRFAVDFESGDRLEITHSRNYEFLEQPFPIASDVTIPVGGYDFNDVEAAVTLGVQRPIVGRLSIQHGSFYDGEKTSFNFGFGGIFGGTRVELTPQLSMEPALSLHRIDLPQGESTTKLATVRTIYALSLLMFVSALVQYNSDVDAVSTNLRLRWEYQPGSELFVVYNEHREDLWPRRFPELQNRAFVVKINRLFRF